MDTIFYDVEHKTDIFASTVLRVKLNAPLETGWKVELRNPYKVENANFLNPHKNENTNPKQNWVIKTMLSKFWSFDKFPP